MQVAEAKTLLERYGFDEGDPLLTWINAAMHIAETAHPWPFLDSETPFAMVAGSNTFAFSTTNAPKIKLITNTGSTPPNKLQFVERTQFERDYEDGGIAIGKPSIYTISQAGLTVKLWPALDADTTLLVVYRGWLDDLVNDTDDLSPFPPAMHYGIVMGAVFIALQAESEEERAATAQKQFEEAIASAWEPYADPVEDEPEEVVDVMGYRTHYR